MKYYSTITSIENIKKNVFPKINQDRFTGIMFLDPAEDAVQYIYYASCNDFIIKIFKEYCKSEVCENPNEFFASLLSQNKWIFLLNELFFKQTKSYKEMCEEWYLTNYKPLFANGVLEHE